MSKNEVQSDQLVNEAALAVLRQAARTQGDVLFPAIDQNFGSPLRMFASNPSTAVLNFSPQEVQLADGTGKSVPPTSSTIPTVAASTINFQTGATTGATFTGLTFPSTTVGQFRRVGFTLLASGQINAIWSNAAASVGALVNPGSIFVPSGVPIGWIDLEATASTAYKTAGSATAIIENSVSGTSRIKVFGSGGSGSGSGNANTFLTALQERLNDSYFNRLASNIFAIDGTTATDPASTATYDIAASPSPQYKFTGIGQVLKSLGLFTPGWLAGTADANQVELIEDWGTVADGGSLREISVDGGLNYNTISMAEIDMTNRYRGVATLADPVTVATLWTYAVANADTTEAFNNTTEVSQGVQFDSVIASGAKKKSTKVTVYISKTGSPSGALSARLVKDNGSNQPSTALADTVATSATQVISALSAGNNTVVFNFKGILPAGTYWLVLDTDATYQSSWVTGTTEILWRTDNSAPTYTGAYSKMSSASSWSAIATKKPTFLVEGITYSLIVRITSVIAASQINGYGVLFEDGAPFSPQVPAGLYEESFSGDIDKTSFTMTFLPDPKRLMALELTGDRAGRCYMYPYFALSGHSVVFPSGTFLDPGVTKQVRFLMIGGSGFDNSDANRALMAANHLGSTDGAVDLSAVGRGIILRRPDGTLREIALTDDDEIQILTVP